MNAPHSSRFSATFGADLRARVDAGLSGDVDSGVKPGLVVVDSNRPASVIGKGFGPLARGQHTLLDAAH